MSTSCLCTVDRAVGVLTDFFHRLLDLLAKTFRQRTSHTKHLDHRIRTPRQFQNNIAGVRLHQLQEVDINDNSDHRRDDQGYPQVVDEVIHGRAAQESHRHGTQEVLPQAQMPLERHLLTFPKKRTFLALETERQHGISPTQTLKPTAVYNKIFIGQSIQAGRISQN